jgi:glycine/D-amino acid oxidase-like deaminating enzyme
MDRRTVLKTGGMALIGMGIGGCAASRPPQTAASPPRPDSILHLPRVQASWDRVIRTTVGLRPHRPAGFNLKVERLDAKTVVHNYGHGGAGHSLGWGTGYMAAELASEHESRRVAVIGCGTVGLTSARQLQRRGFDVTIYAMSVPPDTTSNMALAAFTPTSGLFSTAPTPEWDAQFKRAVDIAYRQLQLLAGPNYGISWIDSYNVSETPPGQPGNAGGNQGGAQGGNQGGNQQASLLLPAHIRQSSGQIVYGPGEHPFPGKYATRRQQIRIEPSIYLDALVRDFLLFGGRIVIRKFDTPRDLMAINEPLIVNCSGLGSRSLFSDETMMPVKGQLTHLVPQPEITYSARGMPRRDGIALGSTMERNVWSLEPNEAERTRIVEACIQFYNAMLPPTPGVQLARSEAPIVPPPVESFFDLVS